MRYSIKRGIIALALITGVLMACTGCETESIVPGKASDMASMLNELDNKDTIASESIVRVKAINSFELNSLDSEQLLIQMIPAYHTIKALGETKNIADENLNVKMIKDDSLKELIISMGSTNMNLIVDGERCYANKETFLNIAKATNESEYAQMKEMFDTVLNGYNWVEAPIQGIETFTMFSLPEGDPDNVLENVEHIKLNKKDIGKVDGYKGRINTEKLKDAYKESGITQDILDLISEDVSIEFHEKDNTYYVYQKIKVAGKFEINIDIKYTLDNVKIDKPDSAEIFSGSSTEQKDRIKEDSIKEEVKPDSSTTSVGEVLFETGNSTKYAAKLSMSSNPSFKLTQFNGNKSNYTEHFSNAAKQLQDVVKSLRDFDSSKEPNITPDYSSVYYSKYENGISTGINYYMSSGGYQAVTYTMYGEPSKMQYEIDNAVKNIENYTGILTSSSDILSLIEQAEGLRAKNNIDLYTVSLEDNGVTLKVTVQSDGGSQSISIESGIKLS